MAAAAPSRAPKRACPDDDGASTIASEPAGSGLEALLAAHSATILSNQAALLRNYDSLQQARFTDIEKTMRASGLAQDALETQTKALWDAVKKLQVGLAIAESVEPPLIAPSFDANYERDIDTTIIRLNTSVAVARAVVQDAIASTLSEAAAGENWAFEGPEVGQRFVVRFSGAGGLGAQRCAKFLQSLKKANNEYARFYVSVAGSSQNVEMFMGADKSAKTIRTEVCTKKLKQAVEALHPTLAGRTHANRRDGRVSVDWVPLARITVPTKEATPVITWNHAVCALHGIETVAAKNKFLDLCENARNGAAIEWAG